MNGYGLAGMIGVPNQCAACGAENALDASVCAACGEPMLPLLQDRLPDTLPPLPDGGLLAAMPDWLRDAPPPTLAARAIEDVHDPATFLTPDDLPDWLRSLGSAALVAENLPGAPVVDRAAQVGLGPLYLPPAPVARPDVAPAPQLSASEPDGSATAQGRLDSGVAAGLATILIIFLLAVLILVIFWLPGR
ncbi:MAG: hypothetical protein ACR2J8_13960 [Thermomicrobiales bacterium]